MVFLNGFPSFRILLGFLAVLVAGWALASDTALAAGIAFLGGMVQAFDWVVSATMVTAIQDLFIYRLSPVLPVEERVSALIPIYNLTATSESSFSIPTR